MFEEVFVVCVHFHFLKSVTMCAVPSSPLLELKQSAALEEVSSGNIEEAIRLLRECVDLNESLYGDSSLETAQSLFTLALCMFKQPCFEDDYLNEIEKYAFRAFSIRQSVKGRIDPSVAITSDFLGTVHGLRGELDKAEEMYRLSLENAITLVGPFHVNTAKEQINLASIILRAGFDLNEARELAENSLRTYMRFYGSEAPQTQSAKSILYSILSRSDSGANIDAILDEIINTQGSEMPPSQQSMR